MSRLLSALAALLADMQLRPGSHHTGSHNTARNHSLVLSMDWPHHHLSLGVTAALAMACMEGSAAERGGGWDGWDKGTSRHSPAGTSGSTPAMLP